MPTNAKEAVAWIGDDAARAKVAAKVEAKRDSDDQRSTVLDHIDRVLAD